MNKALVVISWVVVALATGRTAHADDAVIKGSVRFAGDAPPMQALKMDTDLKCAELHAAEPVLGEEVVVNDNGTLRWVMVYVKSGLTNQTFAPPRDPVVLIQKGCQFRPHVFGMMAKQPLKIVNNDDTLHNVHAMPLLSRGFNIGQPTQGMETIRTFANPEMPIRISCDLHPWMRAYVGVFSHPFYSVTAKDGAFVLNGLPAGEYEIAAWHEKYGEQLQKLTIGAGEIREIVFSFKSSE